LARVKSIPDYSKVHRHVLSEDLPPLLTRVARRGVIADLGSGDGAVLWALERRGLVGERAYAIDLAAERVSRARDLSPLFVGIVADATNVAALADSSVDGVVVSQVIEHLPNDRLLAPEIARLLKPNGWWYVGSVMRGRHSWWFYRIDGERRLDPTHVREYRSPQELIAALSHPGLIIDDVATTPLRFPISDLLLRALALTQIVSFDRITTVYCDLPRLRRLRRLRLRVPGYSTLEVAGRRA
jgi:SAM-dependent methyltransferase